MTDDPPRYDESYPEYKLGALTATNPFGLVLPPQSSIESSATSPRSTDSVMLGT